jgi:hypothetical protein
MRQAATVIGFHAGLVPLRTKKSLAGRLIVRPQAKCLHYESGAGVGKEVCSQV